MLSLRQTWRRTLHWARRLWRGCAPSRSDTPSSHQPNTRAHSWLSVTEATQPSTPKAPCPIHSLLPRQAAPYLDGTSRAAALNKLALWHSTGAFSAHGVEESQHRSTATSLEAAALGDQKAQFVAGTRLWLGMGPPPSLEADDGARRAKARALLSSAAAQGHVMAATALEGMSRGHAAAGAGDL